MRSPSPPPQPRRRAACLQRATDPFHIVLARPSAGRLAPQGATMIIRGLRAVADFEYEFQMAGMNQQLNDDIETVFLMAAVSLQPIASRLVKEIARYGGAIDKFVTPPVAADVKRHLEGEAGA